MQTSPNKQATRAIRYSLTRSHRFGTVAGSLLVFLLIGTTTPALENCENCEQCTVVRHQFQQVYGNITLQPPKTVELAFGNKKVSIKRLEQYTFEKPGTNWGVHGMTTMLCVDDRFLGMTIRVPNAMSQSDFKAKVGDLNEKMECQDDSDVAKKARRLIPGVETCDMYRGSDKVIYLVDGTVATILDVPTLAYILEHQ